MKKFSVEFKKFNNDVIATSAVACTNGLYDHLKITGMSSTPIDEDTYIYFGIYHNKQFVNGGMNYGKFFADYTSANVGDWYYVNPDYNYDDPAENSFPYIKCTGDHSDYTDNVYY